MTARDAEVLADLARRPAVAVAPLPESYEAACNALAECMRVDECRASADGAAALASYARC